MNELTQILKAAAAGNKEASRKLLPLVYDELRKLAAARLAKTPPGNTMQPTALVHEAYLRVAEGESGWEGRNHFFGAAAQAMRDILVEQARRKASVKHGGGRARVDLDRLDVAIERPAEEIIAIDAHLGRLQQHDPRAAQVVALRYFGGMSEPEIAAMLGVSASTVVRDWRFARSWLVREIQAESKGSSTESAS